MLWSLEGKKRQGCWALRPVQRGRFSALTVDGVQKLALAEAAGGALSSPALRDTARARTAIVRVTRNADISVRDIMDRCDATCAP